MTFQHAGNEPIGDAVSWQAKVRQMVCFPSSGSAVDMCAAQGSFMIRHRLSAGLGPGKVAAHPGSCRRRC
jgi:hypothetical protein